jgi:molecular chaperone Hsp33
MLCSLLFVIANQVSIDMKTDYAQRFIFEGSAIRGEIVRLEQSYHTISQQRDYPPSVLKFLGETLVSNVLLSTTIKYQGQTTMQIQQDGPLQLLVAKCNNHLHIRGLAKWDDKYSDQKLNDSVKNGQLVITVQPDNQVDVYQSVVKLNNQPVAQVMDHYFSQSEQLSTRVWLAVNHEFAVGLLIQQVGQDGQDEEQKKAMWEEIVMLTNTVTENELLTLDDKTLLHRLYHEYDLRLFEPKPVEFRCSCSLTKMEGAILTMGRAEAIKLLDQYKKISVKCEYCNYEYSFTEAEAHAILANH